MEIGLSEAKESIPIRTKSRTNFPLKEFRLYIGIERCFAAGVEGRGASERLIGTQGDARRL
jgi:hypothetical protein